MRELTAQERYSRNLTQHVIRTANQHIPKTNPDFKRPVPWWTPECDQLRLERRRALRRYQRTGLVADKIQYKHARARAQFLMNQIRKKSWQDYISNITVNTPLSKVWQRIRKLSRKYTPTHPPCIKVHDHLITEPQEVCKAMADYYSKVSSGENYSEEFNRYRLNIESELSFELENYNAPIQIYEVEDALRDVKDSAPGVDLITYSMVRNLHQTALTELHEIMSELWWEGEFV